MSNVLSAEKREQVVALGRLGWPLETDRRGDRSAAGDRLGVPESGGDRGSATGRLGSVGGWNQALQTDRPRKPTSSTATAGAA